MFFIMFGALFFVFASIIIYYQLPCSRDFFSIIEQMVMWGFFQIDYKFYGSFIMESQIEGGHF